MSQPIIETKNLTKVYRVNKKQSWIKSAFFPKYDELKAVNNISFKIHPGESVAFLGPNGAGKTTTLKMLTGIMHPSSGKLKVMSYLPYERKYEFLKRIALVMGNKNGLSWDLSANQSYQLLATVYGLEQERVDRTVRDLSEMLEVNDCLDRQIRKLSLGQRLKMELIAAIIHQPEILFLDEPTIGLDVVAKGNIREFLRQTNRQKKVTIILTSHDMDDIENVCDRVVVINRGEIIFDGSLEKLIIRYRNKKYVNFIFKKTINLEKLKLYGEISEAKIISCKFRVASEKQSELIAGVTRDFEVDDIDIMPVSLDEIMTDMFGNKLIMSSTANGEMIATGTRNR